MNKLIKSDVLSFPFFLSQLDMLLWFTFFFFFLCFFSLRSRLNLVELLDKYCMEENREANKEGEILIPTAYDFLYLPIDFKYVCSCFIIYIYILTSFVPLLTGFLFIYYQEKEKQRVCICKLHTIKSSLEIFQRF